MSLFALTCGLLLAAGKASVCHVTAAQIAAGECASQTVTTTGFVVDAFKDETDKNYYHLFLFDRGTVLAAAILRDTISLSNLTNLINKVVRITGTIYFPHPGLRQHRQHFLSDVSEVTPLAVVPKAYAITPLPSLEDQEKLDLHAMKSLGLCSLSGKVLAVWQENSVLVETERCGKILIQLSRCAAIPAIGSRISLIGIADTDSIDVIVKCATWKPSEEIWNPAEPPPADFDPRNATDTIWAHQIARKTPIRIHGTVIHVPPEGTPCEPLILECDGIPIRIDPGANPGVFSAIEMHSVVEATGILLSTMDASTLNLPFARMKEKILVIRSPRDIRVIRAPPWWTARRLFIVIGVLLCAILGVLTWIKMLQRVATRRGQQLAAEELAHAEADLKFDERTRLAVELHDSLSQTLTGAAMEIQAATKLRGDAPHVMVEHLNAAALTLQSCRNELRNCLWDLRSQALDVPDMTTAIMRTLEPHVNESNLSVRFNVPRNRFSDNTAHAILRIVRELVLNAIRHGQATAVKVAGALDGNTLLFSVSDNGCGFDPDLRPGVAQGHFGLQGIKERLRAFNGTLSIKSELGTGTKVNIAIKMPAETDKL